VRRRRGRAPPPLAIESHARQLLPTRARRAAAAVAGAAMVHGGPAIHRQALESGRGGGGRAAPAAGLRQIDSCGGAATATRLGLRGQQPPLKMDAQNSFPGSRLQVPGLAAAAPATGAPFPAPSPLPVCGGIVCVRWTGGVRQRRPWANPHTWHSTPFERTLSSLYPLPPPVDSLLRSRGHGHSFGTEGGGAPPKAHQAAATAQPLLSGPRPCHARKLCASSTF
jgi:hypothetical protein